MNKKNIKNGIFSLLIAIFCATGFILANTESLVLPWDFPPYHYTGTLSPSISGSSYPKDWNDAYLRAYRLGITTAPSIEQADMDAPLFRKFIAKMASEFAIKVVGRTPDESKLCVFADIDKETSELQYYIILSCQLGIMGVDYYGNPEDTFNPNYFVTRDQFVTILSRMIFGDEYNIRHNELTFYDRVKNFIKHSLENIGKALGIDLSIHTSIDWYTKHLEVVKKLWVMTDYTPTTKEFRWFVLVIMHTIDTMGIGTIKNNIATSSPLLK